jgi:hypothetical protein
MTFDSNMTRDFAWGRILFLFVSISASAYLTYKFGSYFDNGTDAISIVATIFSILAGVLMALISILGDPSMIIDSTWRTASLKIEENQRELHRKNDIFVVYIALLCSLFLFEITPKTEYKLYSAVQHVSFFLAIFSFFASFSLPFSLMNIQRKRLNNTLNQLKQNK